jgi:sugar phosphate isomerase/epimerase
MMTRRNFLGNALGAAAAGSAIFSQNLDAKGRLAWPGPIGLQLYTVRDLYKQDPAGTLQQVAALGYREVETGFNVPPDVLMPALKTAGLTVPSLYIDVPKTVDDWKGSVEKAKEYGVHYLVVGDSPKMDSEFWKRRADLFNECGKVCLDAGIQFCYHGHFREYQPIDGVSPCDMMLTRCDPRVLKLEMDVFWATYAGIDPVEYFHLHPGRFPLLHIKDMYKDIPINPNEFPHHGEANPFAPVGQGKIDWRRIFAHVKEAGARHIYVEQDFWNMPQMDAAKTSIDYLKSLTLS